MPLCTYDASLSQVGRGTWTWRHRLWRKSRIVGSWDNHHLHYDQQYQQHHPNPQLQWAAVQSIMIIIKVFTMILRILIFQNNHPIDMINVMIMIIVMTMIIVMIITSFIIISKIILIVINIKIILRCNRYRASVRTTSPLWSDVPPGGEIICPAVRSDNHDNHDHVDNQMILKIIWLALRNDQHNNHNHLDKQIINNHNHVDNQIILKIIWPAVRSDHHNNNGRQGLAGSWGQDRDEVSTFLMFLTARFAPAALNSGLNQPGTINDNRNPPGIMKIRPGAINNMKNHLEP